MAKPAIEASRQRKPVKPARRRLTQWAAVLLTLALVGPFLWSVSADKRGRLLKEAAWTNKAKQAKLWVWLGTDVNFATGGGIALHGAAYTGNVDLMQFLIRHGANVDSEAKFEITPLWWARTNGQIDAQRILLAHGANPDTTHINPP